MINYQILAVKNYEILLTGIAKDGIFIKTI